MWRILLLIVLVLALALPVQAKPGKVNKQMTSQTAVKRAVDFEGQGTFSPAERNLIRAQLLGNPSVTSQKTNKDLPPGLQKKIARGKPLPPGWQKKVAPGESLDFQVYRQGEGLPDVLLRRLPPAPVGSEIIRVENKIIRLLSATRTILDVFNLAPTP